MKGIKQILLVTVMMSFVAGFLTACDGDSSKTRTSDRYSESRYGYDVNGLRDRACTNCEYGSVLSDVIGVVDDSMYQMELGLSLYSDRDASYNNLSTFSGTVEAEGTLDVTYSVQGAYNSINCEIPTGLYNVKSERPAQLNGQYFPVTNGLILRAESFHDNYIDLIIEMNPRLNPTGISQVIGSDGYEYSMVLNGYANVTVLEDGRPFCAARVVFKSPRI